MTLVQWPNGREVDPPRDCFGSWIDMRVQVCIYTSKNTRQYLHILHVCTWTNTLKVHPSPKSVHDRSMYLRHSNSRKGECGSTTPLPADSYDQTARRPYTPARYTPKRFTAINDSPDPQPLPFFALFLSRKCPPPPYLPPLFHAAKPRAMVSTHPHPSLRDNVQERMSLSEAYQDLEHNKRYEVKFPCWSE